MRHSSNLSLLIIVLVFGIVALNAEPETCEPGWVASITIDRSQPAFLETGDSDMEFNSLRI